MLHACFGHRAWISVGPIQIRQVAGDALLELLHPCCQFMPGEVPIPTVDRLERAAIDRNERIAEQVQVPAEHHKLSAHPLDRRPIVLAEIRHDLEVRRQPSGQPNQFHIAQGFPLQTPAGLDPVQIPVDVDLQQRGGVICGRPVASGSTPSNPKPFRSSSSTNTSTTRTGLSSAMY